MAPVVEVGWTCGLAVWAAGCACMCVCIYKSYKSYVAVMSPTFLPGSVCSRVRAAIQYWLRLPRSGAAPLFPTLPFPCFSFCPFPLVSSCVNGEARTPPTNLNRGPFCMCLLKCFIQGCADKLASFLRRMRREAWLPVWCDPRCLVVSGGPPCQGVRCVVVVS